MAELNDAWKSSAKIVVAFELIALAEATSATIMHPEWCAALTQEVRHLCLPPMYRPHIIGARALACPRACGMHSATGTRTRVARVRAEYPNQLDYGGIE